ncbi:KedN5 family methylcobalamin-dependent radical SAM C-methyltransferase [Streptomyces sp. NRRL F-5123]|uniref:KedN5 family methylcobalamin-dependent radical SAM C-methyltransferase n=1 Tax=Streptomyces sp. NRRL F-5123 TaxID=1463856 RepID=UPI000B09ACCD|nr:KedN5 family methylcobalamin-dependent radical SAM C-methyltransferase [Streptomyces sp. NRRL F-5123]
MSLVQQGVWATALESMPLAMGYLKATLDGDPDIGTEVDVTIHNFSGGDTLTVMANQLFSEQLPDVLAFSVLGWNVRSFGALAETYKQSKPDGLVVFGGTHVANQGERVFRMNPDVDVVVNAEGEFTFLELVRARLDDRDFSLVPGLSLPGPGHTVVTTEEAPRIEDLSRIPSPFLTNSIEMLDHLGRFRYDVALMETNRGCPYKCAFCYWGGAVGQKVRAFPRERLIEEVDYFAFHEVDTIVLCDANFGLLREDRDFVENVVRIRAKRGFPRSIETSWAKNKSAIFYDIVKQMKEGGLRSSFTLALQTLNDAALTGMNRRNMKINDWESLVAWLQENDLDCYAELIWGAPGETRESFLAGYDDLAVKVPRIATYPLLILPNTHYTEHRDKFGFVTVRGDTDDFEYVLQHETMSVQENREMQRFLFWARTVGENAIFRHLWDPVRELAGMTQSQVLLSMMEWFNGCADPVAAPLRTLDLDLVDAQVVAQTINYMYTEPAFERLVLQWWEEAVLPGLPASAGPFLTDVLRYDMATRPLYDGGPEHVSGLPVVSIGGLDHYVRSSPQLSFDVPAALGAGRAGGTWTVPEPAAWRADLYYKVGFKNHLDSHEVAAQYRGKLSHELGHTGDAAQETESR